VHLIAGISAENGVETFRIVEKFNTKTFSLITEDIIQLGPKAVLFGDQASYHTCPATQEHMKSQNLNLILHVALRPQLNLIETFFALLKGHFRKLRLADAISNKSDKVVEYVNEARNRVTIEQIKNIIKKVRTALQENSIETAVEKA
jgi:hypothetical protein